MILVRLNHLVVKVYDVRDWVHHIVRHGSVQHFHQVDFVALFLKQEEVSDVT
jgi:hypothetical protein